MTKDKESIGTFQYFIAPLIVGIVILLGQSLVQPYVAEKINAKTKRWDAKQNAFLEALLVVDQQITAYPFNIGPDVPNTPAQKGEPPNANDINKAYEKLILFAEDRNIVEAFLGCFGARPGQKFVWHEDRVRLMQLMRKELGFDQIDINNEDVKFWIRALQTTKKQ